jgi:hypothetical protein
MNTKLKPIPELDNLPEDKRDLLHHWIEELGYHKAIQRLREDSGVEVTYNKLYRYYQRVLHHQQLLLSSNVATAVTGAATRSIRDVYPKVVPGATLLREQLGLTSLNLFEVSFFVYLLAKLGCPNSSFPG